MITATFGIMSSLTGSKTVFSLSLLVMGFAVASSVMIVPAAFAQNTTSPGGNQTMPGGNQTTPGGNSTQPVAFPGSNSIVNVQLNGNQTMTPEQGAQMPGQMNGSINVKQAIKDFLTDNLNVTLGDAIATAEAQVANGTTVAAHLDVVQGFLVYRVIVVDINNEIIHNVIVDAGNGSVLASQAISLAELAAMHGGMMMGPHGGMFGGGGPGSQMMMQPPPEMMQPPSGNETSEGPMMGMGFQA
ncbi:hypothetical protein NTE_00918 [Candidatus Nitrososphaera evergladensis SR1]|uniref:PepSY domain-containing protein n=2 Tax=Nitrososphaera TaxID=497726 RepID=A0A075MUK8_9ARCH|nr:hypothetical protein NTE_00918 [Candidatus Nitrososphaera evergladensis SR1]